MWIEAKNLELTVIFFFSILKYYSIVFQFLLCSRYNMCYPRNTPSIWDNAYSPSFYEDWMLTAHSYTLFRRFALGWEELVHPEMTMRLCYLHISLPSLAPIPYCFIQWLTDTGVEKLSSIFSKGETLGAICRSPRIRLRLDFSSCLMTRP